MIWIGKTLHLGHTLAFWLLARLTPSVDAQEDCMAEWLFDRSGSACLILDGDCLRSSGGVVVGWICGSNVYSLRGQHIGWFDGGVIYDSNNCAMAFSHDGTGSLPSVPGLRGTPGMPGLAGVPGRPGISGTPGRPGRGGWSRHNASEYFGS